MKLVILSRVPRWYSFRNDPVTRRFLSDGHEVAGIVVEKTSTFASLREWLQKLGWRVFLGKIMHRAWRMGQRAESREHGAEGIGQRAWDAPDSRGLRCAMRGQRMEDSNQSPVISAQLSNKGEPISKVQITPPVFRVRKHNSPECVDILKNLKPDIIVLRGCGIIKKPVLDVPRIGVINPHYAKLPDFRGVDVTEWSVLCGADVMVTVHTVTAGVDCGAVLTSRAIEVTKDDTSGSLREKSAVLAVELLAEVVNDIAKGRQFPEGEAAPEGGRQYFRMHPRLKELANRRLRHQKTDGGYWTKG